MLAFPGRGGKREFEGCFNTLEAAQKMADRLNPARCARPGRRGPCWRPVFNPPPGVPLRGPARRRKLTVPERHQLRVARDTLKMSPAMAAVMGGPTRAEACEIIERLTGKRPKEC